MKVGSEFPGNLNLRNFSRKHTFQLINVSLSVKTKAMDDLFSKNSQLAQWLRHNEDSIVLIEDGFEDLKQLSCPLDDEIESPQTEGKLSLNRKL